MADFLTAFTAMWNNEGEIWERNDDNGEIYYFKIHEKRARWFDKNEKIWFGVSLGIRELLSIDWRKSSGRKEVSWWEAWEIGKETGADFWFLKDGDELKPVNYKRDWSSWPITRLIDEAQQNSRWFVSTGPIGEAKYK